jgi:hypothetical protein
MPGTIRPCDHDRSRTVDGDLRPRGSTRLEARDRMGCRRLPALLHRRPSLLHVNYWLGKRATRRCNAARAAPPTGRPCALPSQDDRRPLSSAPLASGVEMVEALTIVLALGVPVAGVRRCRRRRRPRRPGRARRRTRSRPQAVPIDTLRLSSVRSCSSGSSGCAKRSSARAAQSAARRGCCVRGRGGRPERQDAAPAGTGTPS